MSNQRVFVLDDNADFRESTAFLLEAITELLFLLKEHTLPFNPEGKSPEQLLEDLVHFALRTVKKGSS